MKCLALFLEAKREEEGPGTRSADEVISLFRRLLRFLAALPSFAGFLWSEGLRGGKGIRKWSLAGPEVPGALEKEGRHVGWRHLPLLLLLALIIFMDFWL